MLQVLQHFRIIFQATRRHSRSVERRAGISGAQLWALAQVAARPGLRVGEIAAALAIHQSTASNLLRRLEALRLVSRSRDGADHRTVQLCATAKGQRVLRRAPQPRIGVLQQALSDLSERKLHMLHRHLGALVAVMKVKSPQARATPISDSWRQR